LYYRATGLNINLDIYIKQARKISFSKLGGGEQGRRLFLKEKKNKNRPEFRRDVRRLLSNPAGAGDCGSTRVCGLFWKTEKENLVGSFFIFVFNNSQPSGGVN